jgi:hypothetical protein
MQIVKQNETFNFKDTTELYEIAGNVSKDLNGSLNIHFTINKIGGEYLGDCHYNKYNEANNVNFGVNCAEEHRDALIEYADTVIDHLLEYFASIN